MGFFQRLRSKGPEHVRPHQWGDEGDPDTRTQDVVESLAFEITRLRGITEDLKDLVETFSPEAGGKSQDAESAN